MTELRPVIRRQPPQIAQVSSISSTMLDVIVALLPALGMAVYLFGIRVLALTAVSVITCVVSEYVYRRLRKLPDTTQDLSACVTGLLLAMTLPVTAPYWAPVLGGVFAEGVDLPEDRLSGAAIVSTGIPQIGFERGLLQELYDDGFGTGYDVAYTYPGIRRVLQAAGRVIRTENDRGVVLLLDTRYDGEKVRELLPNHWRLERIQKMELLRKRLKDFWKA